MTTIKTAEQRFIELTTDGWTGMNIAKVRDRLKDEEIADLRAALESAESDKRKLADMVKIAVGDMRPALQAESAPVVTAELPPLPRAAMLIGPDLESLSLRYTKQQMLDYGRAAIAAQQATAGVPHIERDAALIDLLNHVVDDFREMNPSNYTHDEACDLNNWGIEAVGLAQAVQAAMAAQQGEKQ